MNKFETIYKAVQNKKTDKIPLYEHFCDDEIIEEIMGYDFSDLSIGMTTFTSSLVSDDEMESNLKIWQKRFNFYKEMGYGYLPVELPPLFAQTAKLEKEDTAIYSKGKRQWVNEKDGIIISIDDIENPDYFPDSEHIFDYNLVKNIAKLVPPGMKIIGGFAGGPMEHSMFLLGLEAYFMALFKNVELVDALYKKLHSVFLDITKELVKIPNIEIIRMGDDLGYKTATMISPDLLRKYIFPIYKDVVEVAHSAGKPFILHSCGDLSKVMDDLIDDCKIDAKHSFEDVIMPVVKAKKAWGGRVAILGGLDVDFLTRKGVQELNNHRLKSVGLN
jgi:uroporphyrinogen decarboxylase